MQIHDKPLEIILTGVYFDPFRARGSMPSPAVRVVANPSDNWNGTWAIRKAATFERGISTI